MKLFDPTDLGSFFVQIITTLQVIAAGTYLWQHRWAQAAYWCGAVILNVAVLVIGASK